MMDMLRRLTPLSVRHLSVSIYFFQYLCLTGVLVLACVGGWTLRQLGIPLEPSRRHTAGCHIESYCLLPARPNSR